MGLVSCGSVLTESSIDEVEAPTTGESWPEDYRLARELALAGSQDEAKRIYYRLRDATFSQSLQALIHNDLAALAGDCLRTLA